MTPEPAWTFHPPMAELRSRAISARVDVAQPDLGFHGIEIDSRRLPAKFLQVQRESDTPNGDSPAAGAPPWPLAVADTYVRGDDLVATYQPAAGWPYAPQIYWRAHERLSDAERDAVVGSLSLLVSVQTHLLDTLPRILVSSNVPYTEAFHVSADGASSHAEPLGDRRTIAPAGGVCCILRRLGDLPLSYAEIMPGTDFQELRIWRDTDGNRHIDWELFGEFLEKGVIRRARIEAILLPRERDVELAAACCSALERLPLPLTT